MSIENDLESRLQVARTLGDKEYGVVRHVFEQLLKALSDDAIAGMLIDHATGDRLLAPSIRHEAARRLLENKTDRSAKGAIQTPSGQSGRPTKK